MLAVRVERNESIPQHTSQFRVPKDLPVAFIEGNHTTVEAQEDDVILVHESGGVWENDGFAEHFSSWRRSDPLRHLKGHFPDVFNPLFDAFTDGTFVSQL